MEMCFFSETSRFVIYLLDCGNRWYLPPESHHISDRPGVFYLAMLVMLDKIHFIICLKHYLYPVMDLHDGCCHLVNPNSNPGYHMGAHKKGRVSSLPSPTAGSEFVS